MMTEKVDDNATMSIEDVLIATFSFWGKALLVVGFYILGHYFGRHPAHSPRLLNWGIILTMAAFFAFLSVSTRGTPFALYESLGSVNEYMLVTFITLLIPTALGLDRGDHEHDANAKNHQREETRTVATPAQG